MTTIILAVLGGKGDAPVEPKELSEKVTHVTNEGWAVQAGCACGKGFGQFRVEVVISKRDGRIETRKYRGEELVCQASSPDSRKAMIHTTVVGLAKEEPHDKRN